MNELTPEAGGNLGQKEDRVNPYTQEASRQWVVDVEKSRLSTMDEWLKSISNSFAGEVKDKFFLDIGAGSSSSTQEAIEQMDGRYIALDINYDLLLGQSDETFRVQAAADRLPFANKTVEVSHSRTVLSWLPEDKRVPSIIEQLRVTRERALFINFDWSSVKGGVATQQLKLLMMQILSTAGFMPEYGKSQLGEIEEAAMELHEPFDVNITHNITSSKPSNYLELISDASLSLITLLEENDGTRSVADMMHTRLSAFKNAGEVFTLPDIHTTVVSFTQ